MKIFRITIFSLLLLPAWLLSQAPASIEQDIAHIITDAGINNSNLGMHMISVVDGKEILDIDADRFYIPASSLKVITTFLALDILGWDYRYETKLCYTGKLEQDGTLQGDIVVIGSGDPTLGSWRKQVDNNISKVLNALTNAIKNAGITCIDGDIIIDDSRFDQEYIPKSWTWSDVGNYYGGGVSGLNFHENEYRLFFDRAHPIGHRATIAKISPDIPSLFIESRVTIDKPGTGDNAYIYGGQENNYKIVRGTIPSGKSQFSIRGSVPDPSSFFGYQLYQKLQEHGIKAQSYRPLHRGVQQDLKTIKKLQSLPLKNLVKLANERSINLYCEAFYKTLSSKGTREDAKRVAYNKMDNLGLDTNHIWMVDGSGLSAKNVVQPIFFTEFLKKYHDKWGREKACQLLPEVGKSGTVRNLMRGQKWSGKAYLKSGYIGGVLTYNGYIQGKSGDWYCLSFMCNHYQKETKVVKSAFQRILKKIYLSS